MSTLFIIPIEKNCTLAVCKLHSGRDANRGTIAVFTHEVDLCELGISSHAIYLAFWLGASLQRLGKYREAMRQYSKVLELSKETGEDSGCTEAYGAIADCYTELGDLERAAKVYDKYISRLQPGE